MGSSVERVRGKDLLRMWNTKLIPHTVLASATITLFRFQITILAAIVGIQFQKIVVMWNYIRANNNQ